MSAVELRLLSAVQHLLTTARMQAYYKEDHLRIAELLDRADHLCNLAREGCDGERLDLILRETSDHFPECSRDLLSGPITIANSKRSN
jgi:hypothetical protein